MFLWMAREQYPGEVKAANSRSSRVSERCITSRHLSSARYAQDYTAVLYMLWGNYERCENSAIVDGWQEVRLTRDGEVSTTRQCSEAAGDHVNALTDLIESNSIVAIAAEEVNHFDYYILKSDKQWCYGPWTRWEWRLQNGVPKRGSMFWKATLFCRTILLNDATYKLDSKIAMVYVNTVKALCGELRTINRRRETLFRLSPAQHEEIMSCF